MTGPIDHGRLHYRRAGTGPALVLVHGFLGGSSTWHGQIRRFGPTRDVIAPDLAGFGASRMAMAPDSIEGHARLVIDLVDSLGVEAFELLGHSMGGMVAQKIALIAGSRVERLILYGTGPTGLLPDRFESIDVTRRRIAADGIPATASRIAATWFAAGAADPGFAACEAEGAKASMQAAVASLRAWETWDVSAELAAIASPTLVVWGERDRSIGWNQIASLWRGIPNASLAVVPGCAHNVHLEKAELFDALVADFLGSDRSTPPAAALSP